NTLVPGHLASVYSEVQTSRIGTRCPFRPPLPFHARRRAHHQATGSPDEIAKLFPNLYGQPSAEPVATKLLKISVVLSGGYALGGQNVIYDVFGEARLVS
uniref:Uncharacterized protein n=1 Tax=Triticum urartu TaxID=4572 RepID=A0A8R7V4F5_TRIUA